MKISQTHIRDFFRFKDEEGGKYGLDNHGTFLTLDNSGCSHTKIMNFNTFVIRKVGYSSVTNRDFEIELLKLTYPLRFIRSSNLKRIKELLVGSFFTYMLDKANNTIRVIGKNSSTVTLFSLVTLRIWKENLDSKYAFKKVHPVELTHKLKFKPYK